MDYVGNAARDFRKGYETRGRAADTLREIGRGDVVRIMKSDPYDLTIENASRELGSPLYERGDASLPLRLGKTAYRLRHPHNTRKAMITAGAYAGALENSAFAWVRPVEAAVEDAYLDVDRRLGVLRYRERGPNDLPTVLDDIEGGPKALNEVLAEVRRGNIPEGVAREAMIKYCSEKIGDMERYSRSVEIPSSVPSIRERGKKARRMASVYAGRLAVLQSGAPLEDVTKFQF